MKIVLKLNEESFNYGQTLLSVAYKNLEGHH